MGVAAPPDAAPLLERHDELATITGQLEDARAGRGSLTVVEGPAGIGKTRLLLAAETAATASGMRVLRARGSELEREFPYGVVRQLLEPALASASDDQRRELLGGAAALSGPLFGGEPAGPSSPERLGAVLHGLYWLCANLARQRPVLLAVDDAHWADRASLRFLAYLDGRSGELAIALLIAARPAEAEAERELLGALMAGRRAALVRPAPLSESATRELLAAGLGAEPEEPFVQACRAGTGGTPFLLHELIRELAATGTAPTAAASERVPALAPGTLARWMLERLRALAPGALELARAVAVLGPDADLRHAGALAGVADPAALGDRLAGAAILQTGRPLAFAHPIVRSAIYRDLPAGERARLHAAAARMLAAERAPTDRVSTHLLASEPSADGAVVQTLRAAARSALAAGAPDSAVTYLRRALAEPPAPSERPALLLELGFAESHAGDPEAAGHLRAAIDGMEGHERLTATLALGRTLMNLGRTREALEAFQGTVEGIDDEHDRLVLEGALLAAAQLHRDGADLATRLAARLRERVARRDDAPASVFGPLAAAAFLANEPAESVTELARRALRGHEHVLPETIDRPPGFYYAPFALTIAEQFDDARRVYDLTLADARRLGSALHHALASTFRAALEYRAGRVAAAEADARLALAADPTTAPPAWAALATATLADTLRERGETDQADAELERRWPSEQHTGMVTFADLLCARGRLRLAQTRPADALDDLLAAGRLLHQLHAQSPAYAAWRSHAALALLALERPQDARPLCAEELELARAFGAPRALGIALRAAGIVGAGERGLELLHEAAAALARSNAPLEHARALTDLGAALRRAGHRTAARDPLRTALDLAHRCGATALAERARTELLATGARPRRHVLSGAAALTPSERRVAEMAATGLTNREIAQALFVTQRTVEIHLTHSYQKLDISSREQLPDALA